jgi:small subunit ribosomal protein S1
VSQGQPVNVKIIEVDGERRRLSLSLKRVEDTDPVQPRADGGESVHTQPRPTIDLSEEVFAEAPATIDGEVSDVEETAVEDTAVAETASEDTAVEDTAVEDTAVEDTAVEAPPVDEAVEETPSAEADATGAGVAPADDAAESEAETAPPVAEPEASASEK